MQENIIYRIINTRIYNHHNYCSYIVTQFRIILTLLLKQEHINHMYHKLITKINNSRNYQQLPADIWQKNNLSHCITLVVLQSAGFNSIYKAVWLTQVSAICKTFPKPQFLKQLIESYKFTYGWSHSSIFCFLNIQHSISWSSRCSCYCRQKHNNHLQYHFTT
jgi:hypothetical protein